MFTSNQRCWLTCGFPLLVSSLIPALQAQTTQWTNAGTGDWTIGSNWSAGVPNSSKEAIINNGGTATSAGAAAASSLFVGYEDGNGALSITNGTMTITGASQIGYFSEGSATLAGGTWNTGDLLVGNVGNGTLLINSGVLSVSNSSSVGVSGISTATISGGTWNSGNELWIGIYQGTPTTGTLNVNGGEVSATTVQMASEGNSTGHLNLNGGILLTQAIVEQTGSGGGHINFNGGTLRALQNQTHFLQNFETGDVQLLAGGATIDTNGFNIGISPVLQGVGGLTKMGAGKLTLSGNSTYTGATIINAGTLELTTADAISRSNSITVNTGGTLTTGGTSSAPFS